MGTGESRGGDQVGGLFSEKRGEAGDLLIQTYMCQRCIFAYALDNGSLSPEVLRSQKGMEGMESHTQWL